jgi:hypothetical protein
MCVVCNKAGHGICIEGEEMFGGSGTCLLCIKKNKSSVTPSKPSTSAENVASVTPSKPSTSAENVADPVQTPKPPSFVSPFAKNVCLDNQLVILNPWTLFKDKEMINAKNDEGKKLKKLDTNVIGKLRLASQKPERYEITWTSTLIQNIKTTVKRNVALKGFKAYIDSKTSNSQLNWSKLNSMEETPLNWFDVDDLEEFEEDIEMEGELPVLSSRDRLLYITSVTIVMHGTVQ